MVLCLLNFAIFINQDKNLMFTKNKGVGVYLQKQMAKNVNATTTFPSLYVYTQLRARCSTTAIRWYMNITEKHCCFRTLNGKLPYQFVR